MISLEGKKRINKAFLCYPPVGLYQRGEERCQADIEGSTTQAPHAPNDLGYLASIQRDMGIKTVIKDYPAEGIGSAAAYKEIESFKPDAVIISTTYSTLVDDVEFLKKIKMTVPGAITIAKGSCFFSIPISELKDERFKYLDIAIYVEAEFVIKELMEKLKNKEPLEKIKGIIFNLGGDKTVKTAQPNFHEDLDSLPFPARSLINNRLYKNPVTDRPMATIHVSRGCPAQCIFCLTPIISGQKLRKRSVQNVIEEVKDCIENYGINDFFFRADTFTMDANYVKELCRRIKEDGLKISWVANSRTDVKDETLFKAMKDAGCWLVAFGFESGNDDIQRKIKKGAFSEQALCAVRLCRQAGLKTFGFFMIGFPWETEDTMEDTFRLMRDLDCDFIEVHIAMPFEGTELNRVSKELGLIDGSALGYNYFSNPYGGTLHLSREKVIRFRKKMIRTHYLRPCYIYRMFKHSQSNRETFNYIKYGLRLLANIVR